ncbi:carboxypeptidase regulatory-like domain-containing protein [bacterium]|nr:carboxypeptidase regulatory-like domain-containing protein [bacterium]
MKKLLLVCLSLMIAAGAVFAVDYDKEAVQIAKQTYFSGQELTADQYIMLREMKIIRPDGPSIDFVGGPDAFGYTYKDSEEADGPAYVWEDITGTGTEIGDLLGDDDVEGPLPIGFTFTYYGVDYTEFYVHSNGCVSLVDLGGTASWSNNSLPAFPGPVIAWCWDDFDINSGVDGDVFYETRMVDSQNALVMSYVDCAHYSGPASGLMSGQMILFEDGTIKLQYNYFDANWPVDVQSIGIEDGGGVNFLQADFYDVPANYPYDNLAIEFYPPAGGPDASLSGYVYDADTNDPIVGATVTLGGNSTMTDGSGFYEFLDLYSGMFSWSVSATGYTGQSGDVDILPGANAVDFYLAPVNLDADVLIVDVDETLDSGPAIDAVLQGLGYNTLYTNDFFAYDWMNYDKVFLFTGIYPNDFDIATDSPEETAIIDFINGGGKLYLEGGDNFGFTPPANLMALLPIASTNDGGGDLVNVMGENDLAGLDMNYLGENNWIDHIEPTADASRILYNPADDAGCGILNNDFALFSFELGMLEDNLDWTREDIVSLIMDYLCAAPPMYEVIVECTTPIIPMDGGYACFNITVNNNTQMSHSALIWANVYCPGDCVAGPFGFMCMEFPPGTTYFDNVCVWVPAGASAGDYQFNVMVGAIQQGYIAAMGSAMFTKEGQNIASVGTPDLVFRGFGVAGETAAAGLPTTYQMSNVYPNPFNPTANVNIALPETAELTVSVFNIMGQEVATLASGQFQAGTHNFVLDGSNLASGLYFVRATVPGQLNAMQKVTLMK